MALCSESTGITEAPDFSSVSRKHRTCRNHTFFVCERHDDATPYRFERRLNCGSTNDSNHHEIGGTRTRSDNGFAASRCFDAGSGKRGFQLRMQRGIANHGDLWFDRTRLLSQQLNIGLCGERFNRHSVFAISCARMCDDIERAHADRAG